MKKTLLLSISLLLINLATAQTSWTNSVHVNAGGGIHTLLYNPDDGYRSTGLGFMFEVQYHRVILDDFSLGAGISFMSLNGKSTYNYTLIQNDVILPGANYPATLSTVFNDWGETQNFFQLSIPIEAYYSWELKGIEFMAGAGLAVSLPLGNSYKTKGGTFTRTAHMDTLGVSFADLPNHGLGTFDSTFSGSLKGKVNVALVFDIGANVYATDKYKIYTGLYSSVALSPLYRNGNNTMFDEKLTYHGSITSNMFDKVNYFTFGIKVGIVLVADKKNVNKRPTTKPTSGKSKDGDLNYNDDKIHKAIEEAKSRAVNRAKNATKEENENVNYDDPKVKRSIDEAEKKAKSRTKTE